MCTTRKHEKAVKYKSVFFLKATLPNGDGYGFNLSRSNREPSENPSESRPAQNAYTSNLTSRQGETACSGAVSAAQS